MDAFVPPSPQNAYFSDFPSSGEHSLSSISQRLIFWGRSCAMIYPNVSTLVLITGATGHVGFRVLIHALTAGYSIRCAVRSSQKAKTIISHPLILALSPGPRLSFIVIPDLCVPSAYDEAARGVSHIIHIASPLMSNQIPPPMTKMRFSFSLRYAGH